jgi:hypothetical protein
MKAMMRLDKSQVKRIHIFESSSPTTVFKKTVHIMAGYKNYDVMIVGATGGRSGDTNSDWTPFKTWSAGGGGGGCLKLRGSLTSLPESSPIVVGIGGTAGANGAQMVKAPDGTPGGQSSFNEHVAFGGQGGKGGRYKFTTNSDKDINSEGGDGGGNSAGLGTGGVGGVDGELTTSGSGRWAVEPTHGTFVVGGVSPVVGGGIGGGGGTGRVKELEPGGVPDAGSTGSSGSGFAVAGQPPGTNDGGHGGGANIDTFIDFDGPTGLAPGKDYGTAHGTPNGVVAIVLS